MSDKVLITGACGQLGTELSSLLPEAVKAGRDDLDITDGLAVQGFVSAHKIETIINCAAYTAADKAEDDIETARRINIIGPQNLAKTGCKIVHISTDYVFDGMACRPYRPEDKTNPLSVYGRTKRAGEIAVLNGTGTGIVIRTSWLYSSNGNNFLRTMQRLGSEKESINVVSDQVGTPTYAADLAQAIVQILPQISEKTAGIYHYSNEGVCSWYDFATMIMDYSDLKCRVNPIPSSAYKTRVVRPFYSVLDKTKIKATFGLYIPHWTDGLKRCLARQRD